MQIHRFDNGSYIIAERLTLGRNLRVGPDTHIRATECVIGDDVTIGAHNRFLISQRLEIGALTYIGDHNDFTARTVALGEYVYWDSHVLVGHGGKFSPDAHLTVGAYSMLASYIRLNVNYAVTIGQQVGIGEHVAIWTHGAWLPVLDGFPADFGPVTIGDRVWLTGKCTVLPGRRIGHDVVVGMHALVNKNLPDGCLAGGVPVRVIRENLYPSHEPARDTALLLTILAAYRELAAYKDLAVQVRYDAAARVVECNAARFHLDGLTLTGEVTAEVEDFRDFLRRRGIKFFTGQPFRSVPPPEYAALLAASPDDFAQ